MSSDERAREGRGATRPRAAGRLVGLVLLVGPLAAHPASARPGRATQDPPPPRSTRPAAQDPDPGAGSGSGSGSGAQGAPDGSAGEAAPDAGAGPANAPQGPDGPTSPTEDPSQGEPRRLELRATADRGNSRVVVDRGRRDGLAVGDRGRFFPREGPPLEARVVEVEERSAVLELDDRARAVAPGTRGEVLSRPPVVRATPPPPAPAGADPAVPTEGPASPAEEGAPPEHPAWEDDLEGWSIDQPLLAQIRPLRPEERGVTWSGRAYLGFDGVWGSQSDRSDTRLRLGESITVENPRGLGGRLYVDMELNHATYEVDGLEVQDTTILRVDRLSYAWGGDRFRPERYEVGRFLQWGVPEFGIVDGAEYTQRLDDGSSFGASLGFTPEPTRRLTFSQDLQFAAHYRWVSDPTERLYALAGFQKTFYDNTSDRNLLLGKFGYRPADDWDLLGTVWVDHDSGSGPTETGPLEVTRAWLTARKDFDGEADLEVSYRRRTYADLLRNPNLQEAITASLLDRRENRLRIGGSAWVAPDRRLYGYASAWDDTEADGHDLELGVDARDLWAEGDRVDLAVLTTRGDFEQVSGGRFSYGRTHTDLGWTVLYEYLYSDHLNFVDDQDALVQHRLRGSADLLLGSGWSLSLYAQGVLYDDDDGYSLGFFLQRSF